VLSNFRCSSCTACNASVRRHAHGHTHATGKTRTVSAMSQARHTSHAPSSHPQRQHRGRRGLYSPDRLIKSAGRRSSAGNQTPRTRQSRARSANTRGTRTHPLCKLTERINRAHERYTPGRPSERTGRSGPVKTASGTLGFCPDSWGFPDRTRRDPRFLDLFPVSSGGAVVSTVENPNDRDSSGSFRAPMVAIS
jgi:hypothetical protein